jgi:hypothetical protein
VPDPRRRLLRVAPGGSPQATLLHPVTRWAALRLRGALGGLDRPQSQSDADAVQDIAVELQMPVEKVEARLAALGRRPLAR